MTPQWILVIALGILCILLVVCTIMALRRAQRSEQANKRFALTMSNAYEQVYELDITGGVFYQYFIINGMFEKTPMPEALAVYIARAVREHVYQKDVAIMNQFLSRESLQSYCKLGHPHYIEYRRLSPKGTPYWCSMIAQGIPATRRTPAFVMLYICDINETKSNEEQAQERLRQALRNAEHLSEAKGNFTSRVSHEIRTPLNAIMGYLAIAKQHTTEPERVSDCLTKADVASKHLLSIVSDILDVNAMESGRMKLDESAFKLRDFVGNLSSIYYEQAKEAGRSFVIRLKDITEENLVGDEMRIRQIMMNLVNNALKFTPEGGHIEVTVSQKGVINGVAHMSIVVKDDGIGMKPEFLGHIFDAYEQEEAATARHYGGSGLGLNIVKNLCEMMGGNIQVASQPGQGSTFTVNLPVKCVTYKLPEGATRKAMARLHVLVASGDRSNLEITVDLLKRIGITYDTTITVASALERLEQAESKGEPYDLLILDWELSDRAQCADSLRALADKRLAVATIADQTASEIQDEAGRLSVSKLIQKPLNHSVLLDLFADIVSHNDSSEPLGLDNPPDFTGSRVLLVEDNLLNREIGKELLKSVNLEVDTAENGQIGVNKFHDAPDGTYQLILMDIQMPVMDGFTATKAIRAMQDKPDAASIPIIALTANAYPSDVSQSLAAGMNAHTSKPIDPEVLYNLLNEYLHQ